MAKALRNVFKSSTSSLPKTEYGQFQWVKASDGYIPDNGVIGGEDINGEPMFVSRAEHDVKKQGQQFLTASQSTASDGNRKKKKQSHLCTIPGKLVPSHRVCYVACNGREWAYRNYEVLLEKPGMYWQQVFPGCSFEDAVVGAVDSEGRQVLIGRTQHNNETLVIGYVNRELQELHFPFDGKDIVTKNFEYLCYEN